MTIKWFRLLFPPINGNLRQLSLRRTAPQSKIISKSCRPSRIASTIHHQKRVDIIKKNAELLNEICIKTKLNSATGLPIEKNNSNQSLKKKSSPFLRTRPSTRCFINQGQSKLSKKISTIERFHKICQENRNATRKVSAGEGIIGLLNAPILSHANDRTGFLSRPTTRRAQQRGFSNWEKPIYPTSKDAFGQKESSENMRIIKNTIQQTKMEFNNRDSGKCKRRNYQGVESAAPPMASFVAKNLKNKGAISLKKTSKTVDFAGQSEKLPKIRESPYQFGSIYQDLKKIIFKPSVSSVIKEKACEHDADIDAPKETLPMVKKTANYHLVRNSATGKLEIKSIKSPQLQQKIESSQMKLIPQELSDSAFKEEYPHNLTSAQCMTDVKGNKPKASINIQSEADYAEQLQKKKLFAPSIKPEPKVDTLSLRPSNKNFSVEEDKLLWQKKVRSTRNMERLRKAKELQHLENAYLESNELRYSMPNTNLLEEMQREAYGKYPEAVYQSFCDIAKQYEFFQYLPKPKPKIQISYPTYTLDFAKLERKPNSWTRTTAGKSLPTVHEILPTRNYPSKKRAEQLQKIQEVRELIARTKRANSSYVSAPPIAPKLPKGLLAMCRPCSNEIAAFDVPRRETRGAHALYRHRFRTRKLSQVRVTHNIKKSRAASAESVCKARLRKRGIRSHRLSQNRLMSDNQMDLLSNLENELNGATPKKNCERSATLPSKNTHNKLKSQQSLESYKHCGLIRGKNNNCQCPTADSVKGLDASSRRSYSTSSRHTVYLTTADELLSVCRYCGMVHTNPNQMCPMTEALKLFSAKKEPASFKRIHPIGVNNIANKKMLMKKIKKLQKNLRSFKKAKMVHFKQSHSPQSLVPLPLRNVTLSERTNFLKVKSRQNTCFKSYEKSKLSPTMKFFSHCKNMNDEELTKFTKGLSELLKYLVSGRKHHQNIKLLSDKMQNIAHEQITLIGRQKEEHSNNIYHNLSAYSSGSNKLRQEDTKKVVPEVKLASMKKVGSISNVSRVPDSTLPTKCSFEISCKRINSTKSSSTGQRNFNTSCVYNTTGEVDGKRTKDNQTAQIHEPLDNENSTSENNTRRRRGRSGVIDINITTYHDPQMPKNWAQYKSLAEHRKEVRANDRKPLSNKSPEAIYKELRRKECVDILKQQADIAEHYLKKCRSLPRITTNKNRNGIKISLETITKMSEVTNRPDLVLRSSKTLPVVAKQSEHKTPKKVLKVILKEEPPPQWSNSSTKIDASSDKQARTYSTDKSNDHLKNAETKSVFSTLTTTPPISALTTIPVGPFMKTSKITRRTPGSTQHMSSANKFDVKKCEQPPTCPDCPSRNEPSATRKLCSKDRLKEVVLDLLNMRNSCEMNLIQARMKKQRAKIEARSKEEEFYKYYRSNKHATRPQLACAKIVKQPCEELLCQKKEPPSTHSLSKKSQDSFDVTRCMHSMKDKAQTKTIEDEDIEEEKYCEIKKSKSFKKPSKEYKLMKKNDNSCTNEVHDNDNSIVKSQKKGFYDDYEFSSKKNLTEHQIHARMRDQKKLSREWRSFKKGKDKEKERAECKDDRHQKEEDEEEQTHVIVRSSGMCPSTKAEKYKFDKNPTEFDLEIVIEDQRTPEMKSAEARLRETAEARAATFSAGQQPKLSEESRRLIEKKYDCSKHIQQNKQKREKEELEENIRTEESKAQEEKRSATRLCVENNANKDRCHRDYIEKNPEKMQRVRYEEQEKRKFGRNSEHWLLEEEYEDKKKECRKKGKEIKQKFSGPSDENKYAYEDIDCKEDVGHKEKSRGKQSSSSSKSKRIKYLKDDDMHLERGKTSYSNLKVMINHLENESRKELMCADMRAKLKKERKELEQEREALAREREKARQEEEQREMERQQLEEEKQRQLEKELELEKQREREAAEEKERKRAAEEKEQKRAAEEKERKKAALMAKEQQEKEEKHRRETEKKKIMQKHAECMKPVIHSHMVYADQVSKAGTETTLEDTTLASLSTEIKHINAQVTPKTQREDIQLTAQDAQHSIHQSLHVCYSTEKDEVFEQQKDDQIKYYPKIYKTPPEYRVEPIRNERQNFVEKEIKRLETKQKDIKLDDSKRLFYQDQIKKVQQKLADIKEKRQTDAHKNIESISDYEHLSLVDSLALKTTSDLIAEKVCRKLLKASERKSQVANVKSIDNIISDIIAGNKAMLTRTGVHVVKENGSVTEISTATVNSVKSRLPQKVWTEKITAAMQKPSTAEIARVSKNQMEHAEKIESLKGVSKSTTSVIKGDSRSSCSTSSALVKTNAKPRTMIQQPKTPPRWKYLDPPTIYDYTHFGKSEKSGLQIQKCMNEVKRCLNNYKKCLVDFKLMPKMDKHFDYDNVYMNQSSPSLAHRKSEEVLEDDDEDGKTLKKCKSYTRVDKASSHASKCTTSLNVPLLVSGQHPITSKVKKSKTNVFNNRSRQHHSVDFDLGQDQKSEFERAICLDKTAGEASSTARSSDATSRGVANRSKNVMNRSSYNSQDANRRCRASSPKSAEFRQKQTNATKKADVFDEVTLYFPRGNECVNVELLFHSNQISSPKSNPVDVNVQIEDRVSQNTFCFPASTEGKVDVPEAVPELCQSKEITPSKRKYSYTKLPRPDLAKLEDDIQGQTSLKPIEIFQQMYEATTNKLKNISYAGMQEKTLGYIYGEDDFWPTKHYPQIQARLERPPQLLELAKPVVSHKPEPVVPPPHNSVPSPKMVPTQLQKPKLRVQENLRQITDRVMASQRANPHCTMCRVRALERQRNTTNIYKSVRDEMKNNADKWSEDSKRRLK